MVRPACAGVAAAMQTTLGDFTRFMQAVAQGQRLRARHLGHFSAGWVAVGAARMTGGGRWSGLRWNRRCRPALHRQDHQAAADETGSERGHGAHARRG
jgi:hypothetical protein